MLNYKPHRLYLVFIILISFWLGWTVLIDFFIIPSVFRMVDDFFIAGKLGIVVFSKLNVLELIVASLLVVISTLAYRVNKAVWPLLGTAMLCWCIVMIYFTYLTPKISHLTEIWEASEAGSDILEVKDIQQEHQFYHNLYIGIDTFKLCLLTFMMSMSVYKNKEWS